MVTPQYALVDIKCAYMCMQVCEKLQANLWAKLQINENELTLSQRQTACSIRTV